MAHILSYPDTYLNISWYSSYIISKFGRMNSCNSCGSCRTDTRNDKHHISAHICAIAVTSQLTLRDEYTIFDATIDHNN